MLAQGGMSVVYVASRQDGQFEQQVAIKVLNPLIYPVSGQGNSFSEANLIARLNHPGITKVFDGGLIDYEGVSAHYIVMEYVKGKPLDEWLKTTKIDVNQLLEIFIKLCDALHHAHTHQIIHADLKPANILIDENGMPKLIDFGIARFKEQDDSAPTYVQSYLRALSRSFASPEQFEGQSLTTLSDVYSLARVLKHSLAGIVVKGIVAKELASIVKVATAHNPEERYSSCAQLAQDFIAVKNNKVITVFPATFFYRLHKFVRRQPVWSAIFSTMSLIVCMLALTLSYQYKQLKEETLHKTTVVQFLRELFMAANPAYIEDSPLTLQQLLLQGRNLVDQQLANQPSARLELKEIIAHAYLSMADFNGVQEIWQKEAMPTPALQSVGAFSLFYQGKHQEALQLLNDIKVDEGSDVWLQLQLLHGNILIAQSHYAEAIPFFLAVTAKPGGSIDRQRVIVQAHVNIANARVQLAEFDKALAHIKQAEQLAVAWFPNKYIGKLDLYSVYGDILTETNQLVEAKKYYQRGFDDSVLLLGADHPITATAIRNVGLIEEYQENFIAAIEAYHQAERSYLVHFGQNHLYLGHLWNDLGIAYRNANKFEKSLEYLEKSEKNIVSQFGELHADLGSTLGNKGATLYYLGRYNDAYATLNRALAIDLAVTGELHIRTGTRYFWLAFVGSRLGNNAQSLEYIEKSIVIFTALYGDQHMNLVRCYRVKTQILLALDQRESAFESVNKALHIWSVQENKLTSEVLPLYFEKILTLKLLGRSDDAQNVVATMMLIPTEPNTKERELQEFWQAFSRQQPYDLTQIIGQQVGAEAERLRRLQALSDCTLHQPLMACAATMNVGWLF